MKRLRLLLALSGLLAVIVLPIVFVLGTQAGLRWGLALLEPRLPVQFEDVTGTLLSEVRADLVRYEDEDLRLEVMQLRVTPELACLFAWPLLF